MNELLELDNTIEDLKELTTKTKNLNELITLLEFQSNSTTKSKEEIDLIYKTLVSNTENQKNITENMNLLIEKVKKLINDLEEKESILNEKLTNKMREIDGNIEYKLDAIKNNIDKNNDLRNRELELKINNNFKFIKFLQIGLIIINIILLILVIIK